MEASRLGFQLLQISNILVLEVVQYFEILFYLVNCNKKTCLLEMGNKYTFKMNFLNNTIQQIHYSLTEITKLMKYYLTIKEW